MIDYTKLRKKLIPEPDGESNLILRTATVDAVNSNGTVDLIMSSGVLIPGVPRLASAYAPDGAVVQVLSLRGSLLVIGAVNAGPELGGLQAVKTGTTTTGPGGTNSFSTAVVFGVTFPAIPSVHVNLSNNGASPTATWIYHALSITTTGFTLFGYGAGGTATFSALFRWTAILAP